MTIGRLPADLDRLVELTMARHRKKKTDIVIESLELHPLIQTERELSGDTNRPRKTVMLQDPRIIERVAPWLGRVELFWLLLTREDQAGTEWARGITDQGIAEASCATEEGARQARNRIGGAADQKPGPDEIRLIEWRPSSTDKRKLEYRLLYQNFPAFARRARRQAQTPRAERAND